MRTVIAVLLLSSAVVSAAPVPSHLFSKDDDVVPGLVFAGPGEEQKWVVVTINWEGRAVIRRHSGYGPTAEYGIEEIRKSRKFGYTTELAPDYYP